MRVYAQGNGYNAVYRAKRDADGLWYFQQRDGTFLTPGIGYRMKYPALIWLLAAVVKYSGAKLRLGVE